VAILFCFVYFLLSFPQEKFNQIKQAQQVEREKLSAYDEELSQLRAHVNTQYARQS